MQKPASTTRAFLGSLTLPKWVVIPFLGITILSIIFNGIFITRLNQAPTVTRVPDGDSLDLSDGRRIRLLSIDAPELGRCKASEAQVRLEELALNKRIRLADSVTDDYGRQLANVYIGDTLVNDVMVQEGLAKFVSVKSAEFERLKVSSNISKREKRGIYSDTCRSTDSTTECTIKGNTRAGVKTYYLPDCKQYNNVIVDQSFGDVWFCREEDALTAGFAITPSCL